MGSEALMPGQLRIAGSMSKTKLCRDSPDTNWEARQIERAKQDPAEFAPLYEAYFGLVWRFAMSRLGDEERAADATSKTFIKAMTALSNFGTKPQREFSYALPDDRQEFSLLFRGWNSRGRGTGDSTYLQIHAWP